MSTEKLEKVRELLTGPEREETLRTLSFHAEQSELSPNQFWWVLQGDRGYHAVLPDPAFVQVMAELLLAPSPDSNIEQEGEGE